MRILSFVYGEHCAGITFFENGRPVYCYEEERFCRVKTSTDFNLQTFRFPTFCLNELRYKNNLDFDSIDYFLFPKNGETGATDEFIKNYLSECVNFESIKNKIIKYDHHDAHCALAYYTSGFVDAKCLVVSMDGSGDGHSSKFYLGENNKLHYINGIGTDRVSLGMFYCLLTEFLGFKRLKDEGKIVGMAAHGKFDSGIYNIFDKTIGKIEGIFTKKMDDGHLFSPMFKEFYCSFFEMMGDRYYKNNKLQDFAYTGQYIFEEKIIQILNNLHEMYPDYKKICLSGGVFANVKLNKKVNELEWVDEVYITPPMGDEGLTLGSCLMFNSEQNSQDVFQLNDVYLGSNYSSVEIENTIKDSIDKGFNVSSEPLDFHKIAILLDQGNIVGLFQGRMEYGPRALGNRTILADASKSCAYKKLNDRLHRNDFMPFAPVVLAKFADQVFFINKSRYTAEFMTMLYDTRTEWCDRIPAAVHPIDKTARIQLVHKEKNILLYDILTSFYNLTGIPLLVNTSFNVHEEPIVCWPENALKHLIDGVVDYLIIENRIYYLSK